MAKRARLKLTSFGAALSSEDRTTMRSALVIAGMAAGLAAAQPAIAQQIPFGIEVHGAGALPSGSWTKDHEVGTGYGVGAALHYRPGARLARTPVGRFSSSVWRIGG